MAIPLSWNKYGLLSPTKVRKTRRLMIGTDGLTNSGKTEFLLSLPGPKIILACDRSFDSALDNPTPPPGRKLDDTMFDVVEIPNQGGGKPTTPGAQKFTSDDWGEYFRRYKARLYELIQIPELVSLGMDGDSDSWELQVLAEFGRVSQIHPLQYPGVYAARRTMINRCWDSGKIIVATNKLKALYEDIIDPATGLPERDDKGKNKQRRVDGEYKRQGFFDQDYLWQLQIRHLYKKAEPIDLTGLTPLQRLKVAREGLTKKPPEWGLKILKCKANPSLEGDELWGEHCNFQALVQHVYPHVPPEQWGLPS